MTDTPDPGAATTTVPIGRLLGVLLPAMLLIPIAADMVSLVLPLIAAEFDATTPRVAWVVTGFLLTCAIGIPVYGRIADRFSLRRLFVLALAVFGLGSLICALAPSLPVLVLGRLVMGAGGAAIPVLAVVATARLLPGAKTAVGFGFLGAAAGVGTAAGPAVGGLLGQAAGWPALFWLMTVVSLALVPALWFVVPADPRTDPHPFDLLSGVLLGGAAGLVLFGVTQSGDGEGFTSPSSWMPMAAGGILAALFVWRARTAAHPFAPPSLFTHRGYPAAVVVIFLAMTVNLATIVLVSVLVIDVNGLTSAQGSLVMIPGGLALALVSPLAGRLAARGANPGGMTLIGLTLIGLATLFLSTVAAGSSPVLSGVAITALGAGFAVVVTITTTAASRLLPPEQVGVGVGIFQGAQFLGAGVGPAVFAAMLSARQDGGHDALNPLHPGGAAAYSDTFLVLTAATLLAVAAALRLRKATAQR